MQTGRVLLFPALAAAHLVLLLLLQPPLHKSAPAAIPVLTVIALPEPPVLAEAVPPPITTEIVAEAAMPDFTISADLPVVGSSPCAIADDIQTALAESPAVASAVDRIPATARSVSNALLLWDGGWAMAGTIGGPMALDPIRAVVQAQIRAAPAVCQQEDITGPRLMLVQRAAGAVVLAIGSGIWRWEQLLR